MRRDVIGARSAVGGSRARTWRAEVSRGRVAHLVLVFARGARAVVVGQLGADVVSELVVHVHGARLLVTRAAA